MRRSRSALEIADQVVKLVAGLLNAADTVLEGGGDPPSGVEITLHEAPEGQAWLKVKSTYEILSCGLNPPLFQPGQGTSRSRHEDVRQCLKRLEKVDLLERTEEGDSNRAGIPGTCFFLKFDPTNKVERRAVLAQKGFHLLENSPNSGSIDVAVQRLRQQVVSIIEKECEWAAIIDTWRNVRVADLYVEAEVWQNITRLCDRCPTLEQQHQSSSESLSRYAHLIQEPERHRGSEIARNFSNLWLWGKSGIGKTIYLHRLAMLCIKGDFRADTVPFYVRLSLFSKLAKNYERKDRLFGFLCSRIEGDENLEATLKRVLKAGKAVILLDGLDEVPEADQVWVKDQIQKVLHEYPNNFYVVSCRVAADEYSFDLERFKRVEIADFNWTQVKEFIPAWFRAALDDSDQSESTRLSEALIKALDQSEHTATLELATTPLLLNFICLVFRHHHALPLTRNALFERGINHLLKERDQQRLVHRDEVYPEFREVKEKRRLLQFLARSTFEQSQPIFGEKVAQAIVLEYLQRNHLAPTDPVAREEDSRAILFAIARNHGLLVRRFPEEWSFSHLSHHEYLTAVAIFQAQDWQALLPHLCKPRWREVFLLIAEMDFTTGTADRFIQQMQQQLRKTFAACLELQVWLERANNRAIEVARQTDYSLPGLRSWYVFLKGGKLNVGIETYRRSGQARSLYPAVARARVLGLDEELVADLSEFDDLYNYLNNALSVLPREGPTGELVRSLQSALEHFYEIRRVDILLPELLSIGKFLVSIYDPSRPPQANRFNRWWQQEGAQWATNLLEKLHATDSQENEALAQSPLEVCSLQPEVLTQFYSATLLLVDCMQRCESLSHEVRNAVIDTLLLPHHLTE